MKKETKVLCVLLGIMVLLNVVVFAVPNKVMNVARFSAPVFWVAYAAAMICMLTLLAVTMRLAKKLSDKSRKLLFTGVQYGGMALMFACSALVLCLPVIPAWVTIIIDVLILAACLFAIFKLLNVDEDVEKVDTYFIKSLTADAEILLSYASDGDMAVVRKVHEEIRYSDPMSVEKLADIEQQITDAFNAYSEAVKANQSDVAELANRVLQLLHERNIKCKLFK